MSERKLFCFGLGYCARTLGHKLMAQGWQVAGTARTSEQCAALIKEGFEAVVFTGTEPGAQVSGAMKGATHLLNSVPPEERGDAVLRHHAPEIAEHTDTLEWLGYFSTIGVYGDHGGAWIDERTPVKPLSGRSGWRVQAEETWLAYGGVCGIVPHIFRLPGIYGPGRSQLDALLSGKARRIVKEGQVFNRAHVDDIAQTVLASMKRPNADAIYNICDDEPAPPQDVVAFAAQLLGVEPPPEILFDIADLSPMAASFYGECKRVRNDRIKSELGITLKFPNYREGLEAIHTAGRSN